MDNHKEKLCAELKVILAAELFSKLSEEQQDYIIIQIKALLSHE